MMIFSYVWCYKIYAELHLRILKQINQVVYEEPQLIHFPSFQFCTIIHSVSFSIFFIVWFCKHYYQISSTGLSTFSWLWASATIWTVSVTILSTYETISSTSWHYKQKTNHFDSIIFNDFQPYMSIICHLLYLINPI